MRIDLPDILKNKTVTIVAGGPSLKDFDFSRVKGYVVAVNNSALLIRSDMLVALDKNWQMINSKFMESYAGLFITDREAAVPAVMIEHTGRSVGSLDWTIKTVNLSGFTALAVVLHLGADRIFLLGFDGGYSGEKSNHYHVPRQMNDRTYSSRNEYFDIFKDRNIINVGIGSKIDSFRKVPLEMNFYAA